MTDLSPQAQAVLDAFMGNGTIHGVHLILPRFAAALRAAADQVGEWESAEELRAIAAELEGKGND